MSFSVDSLSALPDQELLLSFNFHRLQMTMSPSLMDEVSQDSPAEGFPEELYKDSLNAQVDAFEASTATPTEITASLVKNGGCIVRNLVNAQDIASIEADVRPWILKDQPSAFKKSSFVLPQTRRVVALPGKSKKFMQCIPGNELYQGVCNQLLSSTYDYWVGQSLKRGVSKPHLNNTIVFSIAPGAKRQELHRDDMNHHITLPELKSHHEYLLGRDASVGLFVAGKKANKANGVTRFIPRSHLWATSQPPHEGLTVYPTLNPGDAFIMLASCYHGGSANSTTDEERLLFSCFMTRGLLRPEENQFLSNPPHVFADYEERIQDLIGLEVSDPVLGWVNFRDPRESLKKEVGVMAWTRNP